MLSSRNLCNKLFFLLLALAAGRLIFFTAENWGNNWPTAVLQIDGAAYVLGAKDIAHSGNLFFLKNIYHSPGYQIFLAILIKVFGSLSAMVAASKILSVSMYVGSLFLLYRIGLRYFTPQVARLGILIFSFSLSWVYYVNMIQYEVLAGFLLLIFLTAFNSKNIVGTGKELILGMLLASILFFLVLIQVRFLVLLSIPLLALRVRGIMSGKGAFSLIVFFVVLLSVWSIAQTIYRDSFYFVMDGWSFRLRVGNHPNATGASFPFTRIIDPSGLDFIVSQPLSFVRLVGKRFLYLWGIIPDMWVIPPEAGNSFFLVLGKIMAALLFFVGAGMHFFRSMREQTIQLKIPIYLTVCAVTLPPLVIFASHRFLVPIMPLISLFQARAVLAGIDGFMRFYNNDTLPGKAAI